MPLPVISVLYGLVAPAVVAGGVLFVSRYFPVGEAGKRLAATLALVGGFWVGYWLLSLGPWAPKSHWHWLPYILLMTIAAGPVTSAAGVSWLERALLFTLAAVVAGWLLTPTWDDLEPSRVVHIAAWSAYVVLLAMLLQPLTRRTPPALLAWMLTATLFAAAAVLLLAGSLRFAQIAAAGGAAMFGMAVVPAGKNGDGHLGGAALSFCVLAAGALLVGRVNSFSDVPLASYLLVPASPLGFWAASFRPLEKRSSWKGCILAAVLPLALLAVAVLLALAAEYPIAGE